MGEKIRKTASAHGNARQKTAVYGGVWQRMTIFCRCHYSSFIFKKPHKQRLFLMRGRKMGENYLDLKAFILNIISLSDDSNR